MSYKYQSTLLKGLTEPTLSLTNAEPRCTAQTQVHWRYSICNTNCQTTSKITFKLLQYPLIQDNSSPPVLVSALSPFFWCKGWRSSCQPCQPLRILALLSALPFLKEPQKPTVNSICLAYSILFLVSTFSPEYFKSVNEKSKAISLDVCPSLKLRILVLRITVSLVGLNTVLMILR